MTNHRIWWAWFLGVTLAGCGGYVPVSPVTPTPPTPVVPPTPVEPPPGPVAQGSITEAAYGAISPGMAQPDVRSALGKPFRSTDAGGFLIDVYAFVGSDSVAWFMFKDGVLARKSRL